MSVQRLGVAYFGNRLLRHVANDMATIAELGFTDVLHTMSENDMRYYGDQMARIVAASRDAGLRVSLAPWGVAGVFGGEVPSYFVAEHPEHRQVDATGRAVPHACPASPATRACLLRWLRSALDCRPDQIIWDEPHWSVPIAQGCHCRVCRQNSPAPGRAGEVLRGLLAELCGHAADAGAKNQVCVLPDELGDPGLGEWAQIARIPGLDVISSDPYWQTAFLPPADFVGAVADRLMHATHGTETAVACWLQGFGLGPEDEDDFCIAVQTLVDAGVPELWTWAFEAAGHMTELGTRDADAVWDFQVRHLAATRQ